MKITEASKALFIAYAKDAGNWNGQPLVGGNVGTDVKAERGNITQLKRAGLITTAVDEGDSFILFTDAGLAYAKENGVDLDWIKADPLRMV